MKINSEGIASASRTELLAIYIYDPDLMGLMPFGEWVIRCKIQGVKVRGA